MTLDPATLSEIEAATPQDGPGVKPFQVWVRAGRWSLQTVRHALRELAQAGRVEFSGAPGRRLYRRRA